MKKIITLLMCCSIAYGSVMAQGTAPLKPQVSKCIYFDVSPPLRDMVKTEPPKADNSWKDGVVWNFPNPFTEKNEPIIGPDHTIQRVMGTNSIDTLLLSFDGSSNTQGFAPPDPDGDVGPNHYFQVVNCHFYIYDKAGNKLLGPMSNSSIFAGLPNNSNDGDGVVLYDEVENRWVFTQFSLPHYPYGPFFEMVAVSQTADPTGAWYRYEFQFTLFPDYPKLGIWSDGIYLTTNNFTSSYAGTGAAALEKAAMYAGDSVARMVYFSLPASNEAYSILPSDCDGAYPPAGTPNFFTYVTTSHLGIYGFHVDWTNPANSTYSQIASIPVATCDFNLTNIPQKGTTHKLDPMARKLMFRLPFRKFADHWAMVANVTVNVGGIAGIRWWELRNDGTDPANWTLYQESTFSPDNNYRWMGSIAIDSLNNIALGYSISSNDMYPSVYYTGRQALDPLSTFTIPERAIIDGGGSQTNDPGNRPRWGDYSAMNCDPSTPGKFWYTQEYYKTSNPNWAWYTRVGAFAFGNLLSAVATAVPNPICKGDSTQLSVSAVGGSGTYTYAWTSVPAGFTSTLQNPVVFPLDSTTYTVTVNDGTNTKTASVAVNVAFTSSNAGNDTTYCSYVPVFTVHGTGTNFDQSIWETLGDGTFDDVYATTTQYHPWTNDKNNGVRLVFHVHSKLPCHGLVTDTVHIMFDPCTGVSNPLAQNLNITVKPNPSNGLFELSIENLGNQTADVNITDLQGRSVYQHVYQASGNTLKCSIDLSNLPRGSYIMKVKTDNRNEIQKIIIQ